MKILRNEVENRLHRVKITLNKKEIACPYSQQCNKAEGGARCNNYYEKCSVYKLASK